MKRRTVVMIALFMLLLSSISIKAECDEERIRSSIANEIDIARDKIQKNSDESFKAYEQYNTKQLFDFIHNIDTTMQQGVILGLIAWSGIVLFVLSGWSYVKMKKERAILSQVMQNVSDMRTDLNSYMSSCYTKTEEPMQPEEQRQEEPKKPRPVASPRVVQFPQPEQRQPVQTPFPPHSQNPYYQQQQQQQQQQQYQQQLQQPQYQQPYPQPQPQPQQRKKSLKEKMVEKRKKRLEDELARVQEKIKDANTASIPVGNGNVPVYSNQDIHNIYGGSSVQDNNNQDYQQNLQGQRKLR